MRRWAAFWREKPKHGDELWVTLLGLLVRVGVLVWAAGRFPPADDGHFYHVVASRIAHGQGYTWLWPDGAVTYAAHYPVGYPAMVGVAYALWGSLPEVAMMLNALIGTAGVWAIYRLCRASGYRGPALFGGLCAALHPTLVFYTPALMTEGVTAALLAVAAWLSVEAAARRRFGWLLSLGLTLGLVVLVRPQALILAPVFGAVAGMDRFWGRVRGAALVTGLAVLVCLPWTVRNCTRLDRCAFVSANGGWNLFIGSAEKATGSWVAIDELGVPPECRTVFGEAAKDQCFGRAGLRNVLGHPVHFLELIPRKLSATFDWSGAPGHYLSASNGAIFDSQSALTLGVFEALVERSIVLCGLVGLGRAQGPRPRLRKVLAALAIPWLFLRQAWVAHLAVVALVSVLGQKAWAPPNRVLAAAVVAATALTHAIFFGAGRYGMVTVLLLIPIAADALLPDSARRTEAIGF